MVQVNFNLSPPRVAMIRQHLDQSPVVLFGGVKVGVNERMAVIVPPAVDQLRIFLAPALQPRLL
jgi:hypothetical protein